MADYDVRCAECEAPMLLRDSRHGKFYGCSNFPGCRGTHGAHPDGRPLGKPADAATKKARREAHAAFDQLWEEGYMKRKSAYRWMQRVMGLDEDDAHIAKFDEEQCAELISHVMEYLEEQDA